MILGHNFVVGVQVYIFTMSRSGLCVKVIGSKVKVL